MSFEPILLEPEESSEQVFPYRRVWFTSWLEVLTLAFAVTLVYGLTQIANAIPNSDQAIGKTGIALVPLAAWIVFSYRAERRAVLPREGLIRLVLLGSLVASGVALPLEAGVFTIDRWLPSAGFFGRVLGYAFTLGVIAEFLKYAVLRYSAWPDRFQQRQDGVAYAIAVAVGYATVLNLNVALDTNTTLNATALRVASITYSHLSVGVIMGLALAELRISNPPLFWMPALLFIASFLSGLYYGFRGVAIVSGLSTAGTASSPIRGFLLALGMISAMYIVLAFIVESADTRMEALTGRRQAP